MLTVAVLSVETANQHGNTCRGCIGDDGDDCALSGCSEGFFPPVVEVPDTCPTCVQPRVVPYVRDAVWSRVSVDFMEQNPNRVYAIIPQDV